MHSRGLNSPLHKREAGTEVNSLDLIREEIAIMKKLHHSNIVSLIEVLDDPDEDSLYMVMEMCKKGVVMKVGLGETADPYDVSESRTFFRDMILGIEYCRDITLSSLISQLTRQYSARSGYSTSRYQARQLSYH